MRLPAKRDIIVGAGQTPGDTIGNGRAIATLFAREGARVLCVDREAGRAEPSPKISAARAPDAGAAIALTPLLPCGEGVGG